MVFSAFDPVDEDRVNNELEYKQRNSKELQSVADPKVASRVAEIYKDAPYIPASVILSMAKAGTSQATVDAAKKSAMVTTANALAPNKKPKRNWFQRNIYDNVKAASRWTFAGLQLIPDLPQNIGSQIFSSNDPAGFDGWFKSTQLGTMVANSSESGSGWFFGGEAAEKQADRARRFRGTINGSAWTIGRDAADVFFTPGSKEYNILSGFIDAAVNIGADPTLAVGKVTKAARAGGEVTSGLIGTKKITKVLAEQLLDKNIVKSAIIPAVKSSDEIENAAKLAKGEAGLNSAEGIAFKASDFGKFVTTDNRAIRMVNRIVETAKDTNKTVEQKSLYFLENIKGIDPVTAKAFAEADDEAKVLGILGTASARLSNNPDDILLSKNIMDYRLSKWQTGVLDTAKERVPLYRSIRNSKWFATMPQGTVVINGSGLDKSKSITTYANYLRGIGLNDETDEFKTVMDKVVAAYSETDPAVARASIKEAYDSALETIIVHAGDKSVVSNTVAKQMVTEARKAFADARAYNIDEIGWADDGGFVQQLRKFIPQEALDEFTPDALDRLVLQGPGALVELLDEMQTLPNFRKMRSLTANPWVQRAVLNKSGEQRGALAWTEFYQNEIWKPLALATGGYVMRNMIDAQTRIAMNGLSGAFRHPQDFFLWVFNKKGAFDITGDKFNVTVGDVAAGWDNEQREFAEAITFDLHKNLQDPVYAQEKAMKNNNFSLVNRGVDADAHTTGYVDNLAILMTDRINQKINRLRLEGLNNRTRVKEIKDWLFDGEGQEFASQLRNYFKQGIRYVDPETGKKGVIQLADDVTDDVLVEWVDRLSNFRVNTIVRDDDSLRVVAGYNKVPLTRRAKNGKLVPMPRVKLAVDDLADDMIIEGDGGLGTLVRLDDGSEGLVVASRAAKGTGVEELSIVPVHPGTALTEDSLGSSALRELLDAKGDAGELALVVKRAERGVLKDDALNQRALKAKDRFVDFFFQGIYGRATQKLEKSPVFRQFYYREVFQSADLLAPSEAAALLARATQGAAEEGISLSRYIGGQNVIDRLKEVSSKTSTKTTRKINPSLVGKSDNALFHGTSNPLIENNFSSVFDVYQPDAENLMGRGIYLTDNGEVAASYTAKGTKQNIEKIGKTKISSSGSVYKIELDKKAKIIDLRNPNKKINDSILEIAEDDWFINSVENANNSIDELLSVINNPNSTGEQSMNAFKKALVGMPMDQADEASLFLTERMSTFADGISYQGGVRRGGLGEHNAFVIFNRDVVKIKETISPVVDIADGAIGTVDQLDDFAKAVALRQTKELLYNATERSNLEDVLRVVIPFGSAWKEVLGTYASSLIEDPTRVRKAQLIFTGATNFDPDNNGQGFFYKDPTTGEYSFNFPFSGDVAQLLTGQDVSLQAPVKRISIGLGVIPSIGPVAQVAASQIIPDTPSTDWITSILLPYGRKEGVSVVPAWVTRAKEAWEGNTQNLQTVYGNTYIETLRALSASGEYDLSDPNEQEQLYADARNKARLIAGMRVLGQFFGPTSPSPEFKIDTIKGDFYGTQLVKEFQKLQANNYDTAVSEFLRIYGNDALLYISNKTESVTGGLEATDEFGEWERTDGKGILDKYPEVGGFMAPGGDNFSFEVWSRQISKGRRRRLTDREIVELAQYKAASSQYRALRDKLPANPTSEQKRWLRQWRVKLNQEYPGFPVVAEFNPGEFPKKIKQLTRLVNENSMAENDVAIATKQYLEAREKAIQQYVANGGSESGFGIAQATAPLRDWLSNIGKALKQETPEFARLYDRLLANEVEA
jgi:hypothetical protein